MELEQFNRAPRSAAIQALIPCVDIHRWCEEIADSRPFTSREMLLVTARAAASPFTADEVAVALAHHPRIGQRPRDNGAEATLARSEQSGVDPADAAIAAALAMGNRAYEERFGRVFLIRAAGRSGAEMLAILQERLRNNVADEALATAEQLREIALLRLEGIVNEEWLVT